MASLSYREIVDILKAHGCYFVRQGKGSHEFWYSPITKRSFAVPSKVQGEGTMHSIFKAAGIDRS